MAACRAGAEGDFARGGIPPEGGKGVIRIRKQLVQGKHGAVRLLKALTVQRQAERGGQIITGFRIQQDGSAAAGDKDQLHEYLTPHVSRVSDRAMK